MSLSCDSRHVCCKECIYGTSENIWERFCQRNFSIQVYLKMGMKGLQ